MRLRVIGGRLKGRPLASPGGLAVRPTAGRVREAIFNILFSRINNAIVLDLFAGTGALGIEALSRGAARAVFVDNSPAALTVIKENLQACGLASTAGTLRQDATRSLSGLAAFNTMFDLVFMDPPYDRGAVNSTLIALAGTGLLQTGALIVLEHSPRELINNDIGRLHLQDRREYGRTIVSFLAYMID
jgi:16S rRNA (guanine966-N2)-methyltransferase